MDDYYDLGAYSRRSRPTSAEAQVWFDRGLNWLFGFNHAEAIKCFGKALEHDPALRHGPLGHRLRRRPELQPALASLRSRRQGARRWPLPTTPCRRRWPSPSRATPVEQALIRALPARYPQREPIEDQSDWDKAFTQRDAQGVRALPRRSRGRAASSSRRS